MTSTVIIDIPSDATKYDDKRYVLILIFACFLLLSGILSGVTQGLLTGANVEDLRRTGEIGIGFIREIPQLGIQITLLVVLLKNKREDYKKVAIQCFILGIFLFLISGHKGVIYSSMGLFIIFFHVKYRGFRWYEYILFYLLIPIVAGFLQAIRGGDLSLIFQNIAVFFAYPLILFESNTLPVINLVSDGSYFFGEEYFAGLVKLIPRFLWEGKPLSFDYTLKELVGYSFEGGGIFVSTPYSLFVNFGYFSWIFYIIWLSFIHHLYTKIINNTTDYSYKILCIFVLLSGSIAITISNIELIVILLLMYMFLYKKKKII